MYSVWYVVDAINAHSEFRISYPADLEQQQAIAESFRRNLLRALNVVLGQLTESSCGYTNLQQTSVPRLDAAKPNSFVAASTSLDLIAKQFAIPKVNF